jgi:hypothetical protein
MWEAMSKRGKVFFVVCLFLGVTLIGDLSYISYSLYNYSHKLEEINDTNLQAIEDLINQLLKYTDVKVFLDAGY